MQRAVLVILLLVPLVVGEIHCSDIGTNGTIYSDTVLDEDIYSEGNCLKIVADNITLDCGNHRLVGGGGGIGIHVFGGNSVAIKNCVVYGFDYGIYSSYASLSSITENEVRGCRIGFYLSSSSEIFLSKNIARMNGKGMYAYAITGSKIVDNRFSENSGYGVEIKSSFSNMVKHNDLTYNRIGLGIYSSGNIDVIGNSLGGCHVGIETDSVGGIHSEGNSGDIVSGSLFESMLRSMRETLAFVLVVGVVFALFVFLKLKRKRDISP
ncbi:MAG: NosD domain-containing protein [Candidatus Micrarchaeota archaeon]